MTWLKWVCSWIVTPAGGAAVCPHAAASPKRAQRNRTLPARFFPIGVRLGNGSAVLARRRGAPLHPSRRIVDHRLAAAHFAGKIALHFHLVALGGEGVAHSLGDAARQHHLAAAEHFTR